MKQCKKLLIAILIILILLFIVYKVDIPMLGSLQTTIRAKIDKFLGLLNTNTVIAKFRSKCGRPTNIELVPKEVILAPIQYDVSEISASANAEFSNDDGVSDIYTDQVYYHSTSGTTTDLSVSPELYESNWSWCKNCSCLYNPTRANVCIASTAGHDPTGSYKYIVHCNVQPIGSHTGWSQCNSCSCLVYANETGRCHDGQIHNTADSKNYFVFLETVPSIPYQSDWSLCSKCGIMQFRNYEGICPSDKGLHNSVGNYNIIVDPKSEEYAQKINNVESIDSLDINDKEFY